MTRHEQNAVQVYCSNCGGDLEQGDVGCRECGSGVARSDCALCHAPVGAGDADCSACHAAPCAECDTWSLPHTKFCPGCGGEFAEADQEQELAECGSCGATATENMSECSQCGAEHCDGCGEWSPEAARFCQGCGLGLFEELGEEQAHVEQPSGTAPLRDGRGGEMPAVEAASGDAWRRLLFGALVDHLSTPNPEPEFVAACCELLMESGIDWEVALRAAARFPGTELPPDIEVEVVALMEQADLTTTLLGVMSEAEEGGHPDNSPSSADGHEPACDGRHTQRQHCNRSAGAA